MILCTSCYPIYISEYRPLVYGMCGKDFDAIKTNRFHLMLVIFLDVPFPCALAFCLSVSRFSRAKRESIFHFVLFVGFHSGVCFSRLGHMYPKP